jgi:TIR domain-containing protein/tetratricopeptide repeat protein/NB-ARC domain-containing protein
MPAQLFISYRRSHKAAVLAARTALAAAGVEVWLDLEDIDPLADFPQRIRAGIDASHAMLVWWSADYAESDICLQELRRGWQHARRHSSDVARRVWVLNPEAGGGHIFAGELNSSNFLTPPPAGSEAAWAGALKRRLDALLPEGPLADERHAEPTPEIFGAPTPSHEFTGRGAELMRIHGALFPARVGTAAAGAAVQIHGLGGLGKTELAAKYVADFAAAYPAGVLWLDLAPWQPARPASEADAQAAWLRALDAALTHAPELWQSLALDAEGQPRPAPEVRERLARHLDDERPCLFVLDNLPELSPLYVRRTILAFLAAPGPQGKTLVTTRDTRPVEGYAAFGLEVLGPDDALRLLARYRPAQAAAERAAMEALVAEVGGHTQTLVLLGERYREDAGGYPRALATVREQGQLPRIEAIADQLRDDLGARARGIVATFAISIEPLPEPARHLLGLASVCAPNTPIPDALLALAFGGEAHEDEFARALAALLRASLLARHGEDGALRIHPLAAQAALALLQPDRAALEAVVAVALCERLALLGDDESQARFLAAEAAQAHHAAARHHSKSGVRLWLWLGRYEKARGAFSLARSATESALALAREVLGEDDHYTLIAMSSLAATLRAQGELAGARALQESVLAAHRRALGEDHPDTLRSMNNLAEMLGAQGDRAGARALQEAVLAARQRVLGEDHPDTLNALANLAATLWAQGDLAGARTLEESALAVRRRVLGEEHPDTLLAMNNLAATLRAQGDLPGARALQEPLLAALQRTWGEEHPDTLRAMSNLAATLADQGELTGARALEEAALAARRRVLGAEHPDTSISAWNLLTTLQQLEEHAAAHGVLADHLRWLAERDPATLGATQRTIRAYVRPLVGLAAD